MWGGNGAASKDTATPQTNSFMASRFTSCFCVYPSSGCLSLEEPELHAFSELPVSHPSVESPVLHVLKFCFLPEAYPDNCRHVDFRQGWVYLRVPGHTNSSWERAGIYRYSTVCCGFPSFHYSPSSLLPTFCTPPLKKSGPKAAHSPVNFLITGSGGHSLSSPSILQSDRHIVVAQ